MKKLLPLLVLSLSSYAGAASFEEKAAQLIAEPTRPLNYIIMARDINKIESPATMADVFDMGNTSKKQSNKIRLVVADEMLKGAQQPVRNEDGVTKSFLCEQESGICMLHMLNSKMNTSVTVVFRVSKDKQTQLPKALTGSGLVPDLGEINTIAAEFIQLRDLNDKTDAAKIKVLKDMTSVDVIITFAADPIQQEESTPPADDDIKIPNVLSSTTVAGSELPDPNKGELDPQPGTSIPGENIEEK